MSTIDRLTDLLPDADVFLALEPEELAGTVLVWLKAALERNPNLHFDRTFLTEESHYSDYPERYLERLRRAVMESWVWLLSEGFIAPDSEWGPSACFITRRGQRMSTTEDVAAYRHANLLPKQLLHPVIAQKIWGDFLRGDYCAAVMKAFKAVEVGVRDAAGYGPSEFGTNLMRKAFDATNGPLADGAALQSEKEGVAHLFAGAVAYYRNSTAHREVEFDATTAAELIMFASHLLKLVDARAAARAQLPHPSP